MTATTISILLNIGSLVLGFGAWGWAVLAIRGRKAAAYRNVVFSFCLCAVSLVMQLFEVRNRALQGDFAAIEDTIGAVVFAAVVLVAVTVVLNLAALVKARKK